MTREPLPYAARKRWHRQWHLVGSRVGDDLRTPCDIRIPVGRAITRQLAGFRTRLPMCASCTVATVGPKTQRGGASMKPAKGQLTAWKFRGGSARG